jgi:hypothetical protein
MHEDLTKPDAAQLAETPKAETSTDERAGLQLREARQRCLQNCLQDALARRSPVRAALGMINAHLMTVTVPLADVLKQGLSAPSLNLDGVAKMLPALDTYQRLTRSIERFGQLDLRMTAQARSKPSSV